MNYFLTFVLFFASLFLNINAFSSTCEAEIQCRFGKGSCSLNSNIKKILGSDGKEILKTLSTNGTCGKKDKYTFCKQISTLTNHETGKFQSKVSSQFICCPDCYRT